MIFKEGMRVVMQDEIYTIQGGIYDLNFNLLRPFCIQPGDTLQMRGGTIVIVEDIFRGRGKRDEYFVTFQNTITRQVGCRQTLVSFCEQIDKFL